MFMRLDNLYMHVLWLNEDVASISRIYVYMYSRVLPLIKDRVLQQSSSGRVRSVAPSVGIL
jgi:hypothetical protein